MTRVEECLDLLKKNPDGISKQGIMDTLKCTDSSVYTAICNLRQKGSKIKFDTVKGVYLLKKPPESSDIPASTTRQYNRKPVNVKLPFPMPKNSEMLTPDKKNDFNDLIGKAAFYYKCAVALIETQQMMKGV